MKMGILLAAVAAVLAACSLGESVGSGGSPGSIRDSVDLSAWTMDSSSNRRFAPAPGMNAIVPFGGKAFVVMQRLDSSWMPHQGVVVVVDPATRATESVIRLPVPNPTGYAIDGNTMYLACSGTPNDGTDGGVVAVDLVNRSARLVVAQSRFGGKGNVSGIQVGGGKGYASIMVWPRRWVVPFDLATGAVDGQIAGIDSVGSTLVVGNSLWIGLAIASAPAVVRYDLATGTLHDTIALQLDPTDLKSAPDGRLVVLETRYAAGGGLGAVDIVDPAVKSVRNLRRMGHSNWALGVEPEGIYLMDRTNATVTLYGGADFGTVALDENVGPGSNPYDAVRFGSETWVARYNANSILILK